MRTERGRYAECLGAFCQQTGIGNDDQFERPVVFAQFEGEVRPYAGRFTGSYRYAQRRRGHGASPCLKHVLDKSFVANPAHPEFGFFLELVHAQGHDCLLEFDIVGRVMLAPFQNFDHVPAKLRLERFA